MHIKSVFKKKNEGRNCAFKIPNYTAVTDGIGGPCLLLCLYHKNMAHLDLENPPTESFYFQVHRSENEKF